MIRKWLHNLGHFHRASCDFKAGQHVMVVFTSFAGLDPHEILVRSAAKRNMSVYFGLPAAPHSADGVNFLEEAFPAYFQFVSRILQEHKTRYTTVRSGSKVGYDVIRGYYSTDEVCLCQVKTSNVHLPMYRELGSMVKKTGKAFVISPYIDLNRYLNC